MAERQHGVISRSQLRDLGMADASISESVARGYLHPVFRAVFAVGHRKIGPCGRMLAATIACGDGAVISHLTAAALLGLTDRPPAVVDVIAKGSSGRGIDGIRRHRVPPPLGDEIGHCKGIPCTSPSRTIIDLSGVLGKRSLRRIVERAAVLRLLEVHAIERQLAAKRRRGAPVLRQILQPWDATDSGEAGMRRPSTTRQPTGTPRLRSELEARLLALIKASDLPTPTCNHRIGAGDTIVEVDFFWPERRVVVEADGHTFHDNPVAFERDRKRDRELQLGGYRVVRFTHRQIEKEPDAVISAISGLLTGSSPAPGA